MQLPPILTASQCRLRPWFAHEAAELTRHADNPNIRRNLWDAFPNQYTHADADSWLADNAGRAPLDGAYAIEVDGHAVGTIAVSPRKVVERLTGEIGYWVAEDYWGRGIATSAVTAVTEAVFEHTDLVRVYVPVFSRNVASMRVLEKSGYSREGILVRSIVKDGTIFDRVVYACTRSSTDPYEPFSQR